LRQKFLETCDRGEGPPRRFKDGYKCFGRYPEKVLTFFDKHMSKRAVAKEELAMVR
jgi:hypothetical protein